MKKTIEDFLASAPISPVSALSYRRDLENIADYFSFDLKKVKKKELVLFFEERAKSLSPSSFSRLISVSRLYFTFLLEKGRVRENLMSGIRAKNFSQKEKAVLTEEECERLLSFSVPGFRGIRDQVMLSVLFHTGIRVSELVGLNRSDVSPGALSCGDERHRRVLTLPPHLSRKLEDYLVLSALYLSEGEDGPLFITAKGNRITRQGFWKNLKDRAIFCGIDKPISPHSLRRYLAVTLLEEGRDREEVRQTLGNADTASLRGYQRKDQ